MRERAPPRTHRGDNTIGCVCGATWRRRASGERFTPAATKTTPMSKPRTKTIEKTHFFLKHTFSRNENNNLHQSNIVIMPNQRRINVFVTLWVIALSGFTEARLLTSPNSKHNLLRNAVSLGVQSAMETNFLPNARRASAQIGTAQHRRRHNSLDMNKSTNVPTSATAKASRHSNARRESTATSSTCNQSTSVNNNYHRITKLNGGGELESRNLEFWENMVCGAISRSVAQVAVHPMNTMKTILQASRRGAGAGAVPAENMVTFQTLAHPSNWKLLTRGAGAQFLLSVPHGALNFAVLELVRRQMNIYLDQRILRQQQSVEKVQKISSAAGPGLDFLSSCISTVCCSVISTPQMMITDTIMAGIYPNLPSACKGLMSSKNGLKGFYTGWWPGLVGKIPSYAFTWTSFQQLKQLHQSLTKRPPKDIENSIMGCVAAATTVCVMIPLDTIKTRVVTSSNYNGMRDAAIRMAREEGMGSFYRGLTPRLMSVVPMIGIQFGVYEYTKKLMLSRTGHDSLGFLPQARNDKDIFDEIAMEVAADDEQPFPAPHIRVEKNEKGNQIPLEKIK